MREGLRQVAERLARLADLLTEQAEVGRVAHQVLEQGRRQPTQLGLVLARARQGLDQPQRAHGERALLAAAGAVVDLVCVVAVAQAVLDQAALVPGAVDGLERVDEAGVVGRDEEDERPAEASGSAPAIQPTWHVTEWRCSERGWLT